MYTRQSLRVKCGNIMSSEFTVSNGVKQGGVLSPILFATYTDGLFKRLEETGVGCHIDGNASKPHISKMHNVQETQ